MDAKKEILLRVYLIYVFVFLAGIAIIAQVVKIQFVEGEYWAGESQNQTLAYKNIDAVRGNIFAADGSLLATSLPNYDVRMDVNADAISKDFFYENIDSLSFCLSSLFKDKTPSQYKKELIRARKEGDRYHLIKRKATYNELKALRTFPILRRGRYKGGLLYEQKNVRERPFQYLAARTIGYDREGVKPVGLEGAYASELKGRSGVRLMQKIAGGVWMPVNDDNEIEPEDGYDLITTIDINIQDVAEHALLTQLMKHNAHHGCVVLMEVETGHVKAIANLSKNSMGGYCEDYNYAIGESTEPGSTFKLASLIAAMEDGYVDLDDSVNTEKGEVMFYDKKMKDSHQGGYGKITVQRAFELSSNVGISKIINGNYSKNPQKFIDRIYKMNLNKPLELELSGEGMPNIKNTKDKDWSGVSLPWMSIGYETKMTPLQILTFYNAVANNGIMVKPRFVKEIQKMGKPIQVMPTEIINSTICSKETIKKARKMLEGVIENGTATNLKNASYKIAGKTGTAQIANAKYGYKYDPEKYNAAISYQASFAGYFPADNPKYSCIVVVNAPSNNVYYGNLVAGPIFKEIADKVHSTNMDIHKELNTAQLLSKNYAPVSKNGCSNDLQAVLSELKISAKNKSKDAEWVNTTVVDKSVELTEKKFPDGIVPNVSGMSVEDAVFLLENKGLIVKLKGRGTIKNQSIAAGNKIEKGSVIMLELI